MKLSDNNLKEIGELKEILNKKDLRYSDSSDSEEEENGKKKKK